jgi:hypothetical protein
MGMAPSAARADGGHSQQHALRGRGAEGERGEGNMQGVAPGTDGPCPCPSGPRAHMHGAVHDQGTHARGGA